MRPPVPLPPPKSLAKQFAADPFDPRMHRATPNREHTALGMLVEVWHWYQTHQAQCGRAFAPMAASIRELLIREAPEQVEFLEKVQCETQP